MTEILVASDAVWVREQLTSVLEAPKVKIRTLDRGPAVLPAIQSHVPDLVILDLQMGNMGGMAICLDLRLEERAGRVKHTPVLMLLDRRADVFLARRSEVDGWLIRPLDPIRLRRAVQLLLDGESYHDQSYLPNPVMSRLASDSIAGAGK